MLAVFPLVRSFPAHRAAPGANIAEADKRGNAAADALARSQAAALWVK